MPKSTALAASQEKWEVSFRPQPAVEDFLAAIDATFGRKASCRVLWDFSRVQSVSLSAESLRTTALHLGATRPMAASGLAMIAPSDLMFGIGRQLHAYAEIHGVGIAIAVFRTRAEALGWLKNPATRR